MKEESVCQVLVGREEATAEWVAVLVMDRAVEWAECIVRTTATDIRRVTITGVVWVVSFP